MDLLLALHFSLSQFVTKCESEKNNYRNRTIFAEVIIKARVTWLLFVTV